MSKVSAVRGKFFSFFFFFVLRVSHTKSTGLIHCAITTPPRTYCQIVFGADKVSEVNSFWTIPIKLISTTPFKLISYIAMCGSSFFKVHLV